MCAFEDFSYSSKKNASLNFTSIFSFCLSIPPKPNPNSVNQSQNCILTPIPLSETSALDCLRIGCQVPEFDSKSSIPKEAAVELLMLSDVLH
ncbi:hypothetical protein AAC387_Pa04g0674 [Persea americana]